MPCFSTWVRLDLGEYDTLEYLNILIEGAVMRPAGVSAICEAIGLANPSSLIAGFKGSVVPVPSRLISQLRERIIYQPYIQR